MPDRISSLKLAWLFGALFLAGCARDPVSSLDDEPGAAADVRSAPLAEAARAPVAEVGAGRIPDFTVGTVWTYDVTIRRRTRPQDESEPWSDWTTRRVEREARGVSEAVIDGQTYVVIHEIDHFLDPPLSMFSRGFDPHRRDATGLYHRPSHVGGVAQSNGGQESLSRRGGPLVDDDLLVPIPARPGMEFISDRVFRQHQVVEGREPLRTGVGIVPTARLRLIAGVHLRPTDEILTWYAPAGRIAAYENIVRGRPGPDGLPHWTQIETRELLRAVTLP